MPRIARVVAPGIPHHITQRGNNRRIVFQDDSDKELYLRLARKYVYECGFRVWAYCLMPNHVHFFGVPDRETSLAETFLHLNTTYAVYFNRKTGLSGHLWQSRFFSSVAYGNPYIRAAVRYVERNPVRVGLARRAEEYRWSSARAHVEKTPDSLLTSPCPLMDEITDWQTYLAGEETPEVLDRIRSCARTGRPLADEDALRGLEAGLGRRLAPRKRGRPREEAEPG